MVKQLFLLGAPEVQKIYEDKIIPAFYEMFFSTETPMRPNVEQYRILQEYISVSMLAGNEEQADRALGIISKYGSHLEKETALFIKEGERIRPHIEQEEPAGNYREGTASFPVQRFLRNAVIDIERLHSIEAERGALYQRLGQVCLSLGLPQEAMRFARTSESGNVPDSLDLWFSLLKSVSDTQIDLLDTCVADIHRYIREQPRHLESAEARLQMTLFDVGAKLILRARKELARMSAQDKLAYLKSAVEQEDRDMIAACALLLDPVFVERWVRDARLTSHQQEIVQEACAAAKVPYACMKKYEQGPEKK